MAILKSRPKIRVRVPNEVRPGESFLAVVLLDCRRAVETDFVRVTLRGTERWVYGSGNAAQQRATEFLSLEATLSEERVYESGSTELPVRFPLAASAPPSFSGRAASISYELKVHVSVPWWPDRVAEFEIHVAPQERPSPKTEVAIFSSSPSGPPDRGPHVELGVSSQWVRSGGVVSGALALSNVEHNRYSEVQVGLLGFEVLHGGVQLRELEYLRYQIRLGAEQAAEGERIPFRFRLPDDAMCELAPAARPNGAAPLVSVYWKLEVVVGVRWASDLTVRVPFAVLPRSPRPGDAPARLAPPTVGSDRLRELWTQVGEELGLRYEAQSLVVQKGETRLLVARDHAGRGGVHVVAELTYPELHLDLDVRPATSIQRAVGGGVRVGAPEWDREHWVSARDAEQAAAALAQLVPILGPAQVRRMDDRRCVVAVRDAGVSARRLDGFVRASLELAEAIERLRLDLPPPPAMAAAVPTWRRLADRMSARLETARMRILGRVGELGVEVRVAFDAKGQPQWTWLGVESPSAIDSSKQGRWSAPEPVESFVETFDGEAAELARIVVEGAAEVQVEHDRVALRFDGRMGDDGGPSGDRVEQRLGRMARLVTLLRGAQGPYR